MLAAVPPAQRATFSPIVVPFVVSIDLRVADDVYPDNFALLVDGGGNDLCLNHAGAITGVLPCLDVTPVGALLDLGGNDRYGDRNNSIGWSRFVRALNGAGSFGGIGSLVDVGGTDRYEDSIVSCTDCTLVPKTFGAQIDANEP